MKGEGGQMWWYMSVIPATGNEGRRSMSLASTNSHFEARLDHRRFCLNPFPTSTPKI